MGIKGSNAERRDEKKKIENMVRKQGLLMGALLSTNRCCYPEAIHSCPFNS
jgi:hypothetical protein